MPRAPTPVVRARCWAGWTSAVVALLAAGGAGAQLAAPEPSAPSRRPTEASLANLRVRPAGDFVKRCSLHQPVCVHGASGTSELDLTAALLVAERSLEGLAALRLPAPLHDAPRGGDGRLDVYLSGSPAAAAHGDPGMAGPRFERSSGFVVAPAQLAGCAGAQRLATAVAEVALFGLDAALEPGALTMLGGYTGTVLEPCGTSELEAVDTAQRAPERTFVGPLGEGDPGSFLFPAFLEDKYGTGEPGKLTFALASISGQFSGAARLVDEPDPFDALRVTQQANGSSLGDTLLEFMVARAFVGSRSDGTFLPDVAKHGALGRVRFEWSVPLASLPRRLAPTRPVEPLGAAYLWLDLEGATDKSELTFIAEWEEPVAFRWALVKVDATGAATSTMNVVPVLGQTRIEKTLRDLTGARGLVIVGLNEGEGRRDEPFDPGQVRESAKSFLVTLFP